MNKLRSAVAALSLTLSVVSSGYAIAGVGFHWGFDFSLSMKDAGRDGILIPGIGAADSAFNLEALPGFAPGDKILGDGERDFVHISRADFKSHPINLGGKVYVDIIPFINTLELSGNFGIWQYRGEVHYLDTDDPVALLAAAGNTDGELLYKTLPVTLDNLERTYWGLSGTPYAKLQLDLSLKKDVFKLPLNLFRFNAGAGLSLNFTTPILGSNLVEDVRLDRGMTPESFVGELTQNGNKIGHDILNKILDELLTPRWGMHIIAGASVKLPVIPIAVYADGKFMIPFTKLDENGQVNGYGVLLNMGVALAF